MKEFKTLKNLKQFKALSKNTDENIVNQRNSLLMVNHHHFSFQEVIMTQYGMLNLWLAFRTSKSRNLNHTQMIDLPYFY